MSTQTMAEFFAREDVRELQEIQKSNRYGSPEHRAAYDALAELASSVGAGAWIAKGEY